MTKQEAAESILDIVTRQLEKIEGEFGCSRFTEHDLGAPGCDSAEDLDEVKAALEVLQS